MTQGTGRFPEKSRLCADDPFVTDFRSGLQLAVNHSKNLILSLRRPFLPGFHNGFVAAISGGPDSTAALAAMVALSPVLDIRLSACHVNHKLRGEESDADQR